LSNALFNDTIDRKLLDMENMFRAIVEKSLSSMLDKPVPVRLTGPKEFEFKEFKGQIAGEVVFAALTATEGGPGKILYAMTKETAGVLGDLLLMGEGNQAFSYEEHMEPVRDFLRESMAAFSSELGLEIGHRVSFEDIKVSLVDLTPADFVGIGWIMTTLEIGLDSPQVMHRIVSMDFCSACFPEAEHAADVHEPVHAPEPEDFNPNPEMALVLDIELPISIELGRTSMLIRDIVKMAPGSIVELDKLSGEPVDLLVNSRLFARGEVVVVDENFAVRITELVTPADHHRMRSN
jgi:flagellar motor switch protein FliN/FliY